MTIGSEFQMRVLRGIADAVIDHADELTQLDSAIGDGDHGHNMRRGMEALIAESAAIAEKPPGEALTAPQSFYAVVPGRQSR